MGHLFVQGGTITDSERNIQIGGATAIHASDFPCSVDYIALGHLHRPQAIEGANCPIRYSGSPIPLRFNEADYRKKVYLLELTDDGTLLCDREIEVPISKVYKELCTVEGDKKHILREARKQTWDDKYIQVKLKLTTSEVGIGDKIRQAFSDQGGDVLSVELELPPPELESLPPVEDIECPEEIFEQYHRVNYDGNAPDDDLAQTFNELLQLVEESE